MSEKDTEENLPKISRATHTRFKAFIKSLLKDDNVDGDVVHKMLESIRVNVSKKLAGEFLMDLIQTVDDPDAEVLEKSYWFGPVKVNYFNVIFISWYQFLDDEDMTGYVTFNTDRYDDLTVSEEYLKELKTSAMTQMLQFVWHGDKEQNKKAKAKIDRLYKWMKDDQKKSDSPAPTPKPKPKPKLEDISKKSWWRK